MVKLVQDTLEAFNWQVLTHASSHHTRLLAFITFLHRWITQFWSSALIHVSTWRNCVSGLMACQIEEKYLRLLLSKTICCISTVNIELQICNFEVPSTCKKRQTVADKSTQAGTVWKICYVHHNGIKKLTEPQLLFVNMETKCLLTNWTCICYPKS